MFVVLIYEFILLYLDLTALLGWQGQYFNFRRVGSDVYFSTCLVKKTDCYSKYEYPTYNV